MKFKGIEVEIIPHNAQRYPTAGDWQWENVLEGTGYLEAKEIIGQKLTINVSDTGDEGSNFLIALHEIIEAFLCWMAGISEKDVDNWDMAHLDENDPGSLTGCPYLLQHTIATSVEVLICCALRISWSEHNERINNLFKEEKPPEERSGPNEMVDNFFPSNWTSERPEEN